MKIKKVFRYYCDYCKKSGGSKHYMKIHEEHCTMNPNRTCRMCILAENEQAKMGDMLAILPDIKKYNIDDIYSFFAPFDKEIENALIELRRISGNCPACILAALRQKKIPIMIVSGFNYKKEINDFWIKYSERQMKHKKRKL